MMINDCRFQKFICKSNLIQLIPALFDEYRLIFFLFVHRMVSFSLKHIIHPALQNTTALLPKHYSAIQ